MHHVFQGGEGAIVMIGGPHHLTAEGAMTPKRLEGAGDSWSWTRCRTCHRSPFLNLLPIVPATCDSCLAHFATLVFFRNRFHAHTVILDRSHCVCTSLGES